MIKIEEATKVVQTKTNGPWSQEFRDRVNDVRLKGDLTYTEIAQRLGNFSYSYIYNLTRGRGNFNMRSDHAPVILAGLRSLELEIMGEIKEPGFSNRPSDELQELISSIHKLGFSVELRPLQAA